MTGSPIDRGIRAVRHWSFVVVPFVVVAILVVAAPRQAGSTTVWDEFYRPFVGAEYERASSLPELVTMSDVVVLASISDARPGRVFKADEPAYRGDASTAYYVSAFLDVEEVLGGRLTTEGRPEVEFFVVDKEAVDSTAKVLRGQRGVFALRNKGQEARLAGDTARNIALEDQFYRLVSSQGFFGEEDGKVTAPGRYDPDWSESRAGGSFSALVDEIRSIR